MSEWATLGEAQDALIQALEVVRTIDADIEGHREKIAASQERIRVREGEQLHWSGVAKRALAVVAMGFHMTVKDDAHE